MPTGKPPGDGSVKAIYNVLKAISVERSRYGRGKAAAVMAGDRQELERYDRLEKGLKEVEPELMAHLMSALKREHNVR